MALLTRWILVVKFLGATDLCILCGLSVDAEHIESKKTFIIRVSLRDENEGMAAMYSSASLSD